ncbi:glycosyltransferase family 2 protein [Patescibacteria group bacterium]|nr:glycosyltransferase family 2 protein [Patescibacteria group bacterium]
MIDLSIIIVSYNTKQFLLNCLRSIIDTTRNISCEIIVVDNASLDGTSSAISDFTAQTEVKFVENKKNLGFSKANNIGVKKSRGRYLLFLNPDTLIYEGALEAMVRFMDQHLDAGVATCRMNLPNGEIDDASHRGFPTPLRAFFYFAGLSRIFPKSPLFNGYHLGYKDLDKIHEIEACAGAFMLVRREAGDKIGWWDEDYFFYGEDLDFCYEIKQKVWKIYYAPTVSILHYKGVSGGLKNISQEITTATKETKRRATKERFKAMRIFYRKHYREKYPGIITFLVFLGIFFKERFF